MKSLYRPLPRASALAIALALVGLASPARAQSGPSTAPAAATEEPASPPVATPAPFEGALGLILAYKPAFSGSSDQQVKPNLAGFLRWGRITVSGAGGFTTKAKDDVERGVSALLLRRDRLRVQLALRFDPGRSESDSDQLAGLGDIRSTVRAQFGLRWEPAPFWAVNISSSVDALNRVGGYVVTGGVSRTFEFSGAQRLILGAAMSGAGDRYMQAWYGVTPEQSLASRYPVYSAAEGLRDVSVSATWRDEFAPQWAGFASAGASRLLGPAASSPLALQRQGYQFSLGVVRRF